MLYNGVRSSVQLTVFSSDHVGLHLVRMSVWPYPGRMFIEILWTTLISSGLPLPIAKKQPHSHVDDPESPLSIQQASQCHVPCPGEGQWKPTKVWNVIKVWAHVGSGSSGVWVIFPRWVRVVDPKAWHKRFWEDSCGLAQAKKNTQKPPHDSSSRVGAKMFSSSNQMARQTWARHSCPSFGLDR